LREFRQPSRAKNLHVLRFTSVNSRTPSARGAAGRSRSHSRDTPTRDQRKEATRRALIAAALKLLDERSFSALSLREVTREAGVVPAAFYRHFDSMDALGLVLIDESFRALRDSLAQHSFDPAEIDAFKREGRP
jgi:AcrR family transcriptional regulator